VSVSVSPRSGGKSTASKTRCTFECVKCVAWLQVHCDAACNLYLTIPGGNIEVHEGGKFFADPYAI
jgi:hypothetical protein